MTIGVRPDGRPDRRHREGKTEAEVTRKVRELEGKRDAGKTSRPSRVPTVAQWMRIYLAEMAPLRVSQGTIDSTYRPKAERWIIPKLGQHRLVGFDYLAASMGRGWSAEPLAGEH